MQKLKTQESYLGFYTTALKNWVAPNRALLMNSKNSPMFLLCFAASNPSKKVGELALRGVNYILEHIYEE